MLAVPLPGQKLESLVQRDQNTVFFNRDSEQICVSDLLMSVNAFTKRSGKDRPISRNWPIPVARMFFESFQDFGRLPNRYLAHIRIRRNSKQARFGKGAQTPIEAGSIKPFHHRLMMHMSLLGKRYQYIHIKQI